MKTKIIKEDGYKEALFGIGLNKKLTSDYEDFLSLPSEIQVKLVDVAQKLAPLDGGHNKFLESIIVWLDIKAPLYWWKQFDTYRVGVTKQSDSTMHTLMKNEIKLKDFEIGKELPIEILEFVITRLNDLILLNKFDAVNKLLPQSYLQRRIVVTNYKTLKNIYHQRKNHKLPEWQTFCKELKNIYYFELIK